MLSPNERYLFILLVVICLTAGYYTFADMVAIVNKGQGTLHWNEMPKRLWNGLFALLSQGRITRHRRLSSIFHLFVAYAFLYYNLVNVVDLARGFFEVDMNSFGIVGNVYRLIADVLNVLGLAAVVYFIVRRFIAKDSSLSIRENVLLNEKARTGVAKDSLVVALFIFFHLGFRFLGESFHIAHYGADMWQPFANALSMVWLSLEHAKVMGETAFQFGIHAGWWLSLGLILLFIPYFPQTKHAHLFMGPLNFMTRPERTALGALDPINFDDQSIEQFGVATLYDLPKTQIIDAFACIMCNRCQDACPAYNTGKELSPAAIEVNKRYYLRENMHGLATGEISPIPLLNLTLSESALWACTSCGACVDVCPVGNEPMQDILQMRRNQVLMEDSYPHELQVAFKGLERAGNPWNNPDSRLGWAENLPFEVKTVDENPNYEVLLWVGCAGAFDPNAQKVVRAMATVLNAAGVNFAVLGDQETCTGDSARRAGNEYLFFEMAKGNIQTLNKYKANERTIVTSCPHCLTTIGKEYGPLGGKYRVLHHTQMIADLVGKGKLTLKNKILETVTFHDPCYLGRHNDIYDDPRQALAQAGMTLLEMKRTKSDSFCCGAGGAQMWKEEEHGTEAVNLNRFNEAKNTGAKNIAVGCPFCAQMLRDAKDHTGSSVKVRDVAEVIAEALGK